jgi:ethanolamine utilization microcompartment shell protein EutS
MMRDLVTRLPPRYRWTLHNLIAHPVSEILYQLGFESASNAVHDGTVPYHTPGDGRG